MHRLLVQSDAEAAVELRTFALRDTPFAFAADPENDRGSDVETVRAGLANPDFAYAGSFDDASGRLVAIALRIREPNPKTRHLAWIVSVYTHRDFRREGRSRGVLELLIAGARETPGIDALRLSVSARCPEAQALYESLGFVAWGREPDALRIGDESADEIHMRLTF